MRIDEVIRGLHQFIARVRVGGLICDLGLQSATVQQARALLAKSYGAQNIISCVAVLDESETSSESAKPIKPIEPLKTIKPKSAVIKSIKPLTPKQYNKKSEADLNNWRKKKQRQTKAQKKIQSDYAKLADINRGPA
ncbi:MAG: hypothetical protein CFE38_19130 [Comamonadaceae bacterium PBBC1]|nr:MAG: hypothetical protein CFE38_19130 [Comamonadaceae bacterium PBBC1]